MKKNWEEKFKEKIKERKQKFSTSSGIKVDRFYTSDDLSGLKII